MTKDPPPYRIVKSRTQSEKDSPYICGFCQERFSEKHLHTQHISECKSWAKG